MKYKVIPTTKFKKEYVFKRNKCPRENLGGRNHKLPFIF